jgi:hypothetical protein
MLQCAKYFSMLLLATGWVAGCGNSTTATVDDAPPQAVDAPPASMFNVKWGPFSVAKGAEDTRCVTVKVNNAAAIKVHAIVNTLSNGSHHMIVYRDNVATAENLTPTPCQPFAGALQAGGGTTPIMISQKRVDTLTLPAGVAYTFKPNQFMRLEMHYFNSTDAALDVSAVSEFVTIPDSQVQNEADFMFMGTPDILLPAGATQTVKRYLPLPPEYNGVKIFAITGHTHKLGTNVRVGYAKAINMPTTQVYQPTNFNWDEPETTTATPPFTVPTGGGFDFECSYKNTTGGEVKFGEATTNEMCFFWAYYYPSKGAKVCVVSEQGLGPPGINACCPNPGSPLCSRLGL